MLLAVRIVFVIYIAAMVVMGILWRGALRQPPTPRANPASSPNVIPFRNVAVRSGGRELSES